jgi:hypothetical protein
MHCAAHCTLLTTRMPKLWLRSVFVALASVWFSKDYLFLFLILKIVTTTNPATPIKGVPKMNQSSVMWGRNLKCPCDPATPTIKRKHPKIITTEKKTVNAFIYLYIYTTIKPSSVHLGYYVRKQNASFELNT